MQIRGAMHLHSTFSNDGTLTIAELAGLFRQRGYRYIAITEHAEDLDDGKKQTLLERCRQWSRDGFCVIPGAEFTCAEQHILGIGAVGASQTDALEAIEMIHGSGGMAVLAHPSRVGWKCAARILQAVDAVEIWNVGYDGKFLPPANAFAGFAAMRQVNPGLLALAGHDLHRRESFYDVGLEMDLPSLSADSILEGLRRGRYQIGSRFVRIGSRADISPVKAKWLQLLSEQLRYLRSARSFLMELRP